MLLAMFAMPGAVRGADVAYQRDIRPIFQAHCSGCHGPDKQESGLRLDTIAGLREGGYSGPLLVEGKSAESRLMAALSGTGDALPMPPPDRPQLEQVQIELIRAWIDAGAIATDEVASETAAQQARDHWSFQPVKRPGLPIVQNMSWVKNPIDAFVLARIEAAGLAPSPEADRATLIRRVSLDLLGLLPSPAEVQAFVDDTRADAYEQLVNRLLDSPHYGERWGRYWLDQARYADSNGYTIDSGRSIWKYRDWVIGALNRDLPFDEFTIDQIAGDMLPMAGVNDVVATGFHRNTLKNEEGGTDPEQFRVESVVDRVSTTGSVWLGLTIGCARCHDHKYDPITQREFYEFFALLNNADEPSLPVPTDQQAKEEPALLAEIAQVEKRLKDLDDNSPGRQADWERQFAGRLDVASTSADPVESLPEPVRLAMAVPLAERSDEQKQLVTEHFRKVDKERIPLATVYDELKQRQSQLASSITSTLVMKERDVPRETFMMIRGDFLRPGARVTPAVPSVLPPLVASSAQANRLDLARWLVDASNPLTPRVTMNRIWQQYFGQGIVTTENDFGTQGSPPTHPELLDWLAAELIERRWSLKAMHKTIVNSATYRQSSAWRADLAESDPANQLLARQSRLRLDAELIRDAALSASGLLTPEIGGPGVYPPQPEGIYRFTQQVKFWSESSGPQRYRRGLYTYFWRSSPYPFLSTFDAPDANTACTRRVRSNTPLQALTLANDRVFIELAKGLAARVLREAPADESQRLRYAFRLCLAREPAPAEESRLARFLAAQRTRLVADPAATEALAPADRPAEIEAVEGAAWTALARVMMNVDEFITRE